MRTTEPLANPSRSSQNASDHDAAQRASSQFFAAHASTGRSMEMLTAGSEAHFITPCSIFDTVNRDDNRPDASARRRAAKNAREAPWIR